MHIRMELPKLALVALGVLAAGWGGPQRATAEELKKYEPKAADSVQSVRELTPYLDRWSSPGNDQFTIFRDPNLRSPYQGDVPIYKDWLFLNLELVVDLFYKHRENPDFRRGAPGKFNSNNDFRRLITLGGFELRNADDVFNPATWRLRIIGAAEADADFNALEAGHSEHGALQEAFFEMRLFDAGDLDLAFGRVGIEPFKSEFHGMIFFDNAPSLRLFGTYAKKRFQYNLASFRPFQKDASSNLNDFGRAMQERYVTLGSLKVVDVLPGFDGEFSLHWDHNRDDFKVLGTPLRKEVDAIYIGSTFNGRLGPINFNPAAYFVCGTNEIPGGKDTDITAGTVVLDAAYTLPQADFVTLRTGYLFQSGDDNPGSGNQHGFAAINDNVALFGAGASYWVGEAIFFNPTNVQQLVKTNSAFLQPNNFDSAGLHLVNAGSFIKITQRVDSAINLNYMRFAEAEGMERQLAAIPAVGDVDDNIGVDLNALLEWRPGLLNNFVIDVAASVLFPTDGFQDTFGTDTTVWAMTTDIRYIY